MATVVAKEGKFWLCRYYVMGCKGFFPTEEGKIDHEKLCLCEEKYNIEAGRLITRVEFFMKRIQDEGLDSVADKILFYNHRENKKGELNPILGLTGFYT